MNFKEISQKYLNSSDFQSLAPNSKANYRSKIMTLEGFGANISSLYSAILSMDVSNSTKNVYISVLKAVYSWAERIGITNNQTALLPRKSLPTNPQTGYLSKEEVALVVSQNLTESEALYANFFKALFYTGCRPSELYNLTWDQVGHEYISIVGAKRNESSRVSRKCSVIPEIRECLNYARDRRPNDLSSEPVFTGCRGERLNPQHTRRVLHSLMERAGVGHKQLRMARSGLATEMIRAGYSVYDVKNQLGHSNIGTTERYLRTTLEERADGYSGV